MPLSRFSLCNRRGDHHECQHGHKKYVSFPPYAAPGGLRERIFHRSTPISQYRNAIEIALPASKAFTVTSKRKDPLSSCYYESGGDSRISEYSDHQSPEASDSDGSQPHEASDQRYEHGVLIYHESARSIVFRDHVRRADYKSQKSKESLDGDSGHGKHSAHGRHDSHRKHEETIKVVNFQPETKPFPPLDLNAKDEFTPLLREVMPDDLSPAECETVEMLETQHACVKTLKNNEWESFLHRFWAAQPSRDSMQMKRPDVHADISPHDEYSFNSFVTSTSLLPPRGLKMKTYGSLKEYTIGVVFALPSSFVCGETEAAAVKRTQTWAWPSGYAAKTEFNIDSHGNLINGRQQALVSLHQLRQHNHDFLYKADCNLLGRTIKVGHQTVPYNEVFLRVGGVGRIVNSRDVDTGEERNDGKCTGRTFDHGVGLPIAFFARSLIYGHIIELLRIRARAIHLFGKTVMKDIPLLCITPEFGVRVLTSKLEQQLLKTAVYELNPFQNISIAYKTSFENTAKEQMHEKIEELLDVGADNMKRVLTPEERGHIAGGFGATDESVISLLLDAKRLDRVDSGSERVSLKGAVEHHHHHMQNVVENGLSSAVRADDYHIARQLLILYTLVSNKTDDIHLQRYLSPAESNFPEAHIGIETEDDLSLVKSTTACADYLPPPPPLDTDRLRSATSSDGLLAVLGAAQVLRAMRDGGSRKRTLESVAAIEEWVHQGEHSVAFRVASWRDQHAAQADLQLNIEHETNFLAFVSNKALVNRKTFAKQLKTAVSSTDFQSVKFLRVIYEILSQMQNPCLRLELLQFVFGLDNRYSIAHLKRSVELAATCLSVVAHTHTSTASISQAIEEGTELTDDSSERVQHIALK